MDQEWNLNGPSIHLDKQKAQESGRVIHSR